MLCDRPSNTMKIVYRAGDITEAEIVKGMLNSNGIEAHVSGYYLQGGVGEIGVMDLAKVHVPDDEFKNACELVLEYQGKEPAKENISKDSGREATGQNNKIFVTVTMIIIVSILGYWFGV